VQAKVAMLHYTCPPVVGGVESVMAAHARLFAARGYPVTILAGRGSDKQFSSQDVQTIIEPLFDSKNDRLLQINRALDEGKVPTDFEVYAREAYRRLLELLEGFDFCIVHNAFTMHKNLPLSLALIKAAENLKVKFIGWTHDLAWADPLYKSVLFERYPWNMLKQPVAQVSYVTVSAQRQQSLCEIFMPALTPEQVLIAPNGIGLEDFLAIGEETSELLEQSGISAARREGALLLLLPSRITRRKNIETAIMVTARLKELGQNPRLIVTGPPGPHNIRNDEYVRELFALRDKESIKDETIFLVERWQDDEKKPRAVSDSVVADLYRYCDALLFPSAQEGFGIPILEAALARLPIFCSDIPPLRQLVGNYATCFAPDEKPEIIAGKIIEGLTQNPLYQLRREAILNFSWDGIFERQIITLLR